MIDIGFNEIVLVAARWVHAIAATAWIGGSMLFAFVLRPALRGDPEAMARVLGPVGRLYRELVDISVVAIIVSGIVLTFERLTDAAATPLYGGILAVKLVIAFAMFYLIWELRRSGPSRSPRHAWLRRFSWLLGYNAIVAMGVLVYFLADLLNVVFQRSLG